MYAREEKRNSNEKMQRAFDMAEVKRTYIRLKVEFRNFFFFFFFSLAATTRTSLSRDFVFPGEREGEVDRDEFFMPRAKRGEWKVSLSRSDFSNFSWGITLLD